MIVTFNITDFPNVTLKEHSLRAVHPDSFLCSLFDGDPSLFLHSVGAHMASLKNPPKTADAYIATLKANGIKTLAQQLEPLLAST